MVKDGFLSAFLALLIAGIGALLAMPVMGPPIPSFQSPVGTPATPLPKVSPEIGAAGTVSPTSSPPSSPTPTTPPTPSRPVMTATPSPPPSPIPPPPAPSATPTSVVSGLPGLFQGLSSRWPLAGAICGAVLVVLLLVLTALLVFRRRPRPRRPTRPLPQVPPSPPWLEFTVAGRVRRQPLEKESLTIGRAPNNDLVITPEFAGWETVSRRHARIYRRGEDWVVEDLGSTNGIYVNGRRTGRNLLRDGWRMELGSVAFTFRAGRGGAA